jgi:hypothetical protein
MQRRLASTVAAGIVALALAACGSADNDSSLPGETTPGGTAPGRGSLSITVTPNPIAAESLGDDRYRFPFTVVVRETGGARVDVARVGIEADAMGLPLYSHSLDREEIAQSGFPTSVAAGGELRYSVAPSGSVPNESLFGAVSGEVFVEGTDEHGNAVRATQRVSVRK